MNFVQKALYYKQVDLDRVQIATKVAPMVAGVLTAEANLIVKAVRKAHAVDEGELLRAVDHAQREAKPLWLSLFKRIYGPEVQPFADRVWEQFGRAKSTPVGLLRLESKAPTGPEIDIWHDTMSEYLVLHSSEMIQGITNITRTQVRHDLQDGVAAGESVRKIAKRIEKRQLQQIIPKRSTVIARTEVISASNLSSQAAAKALGMQLIKEWLATPGPRTRPAHSAANGQKRPMDAPYTVMGESLMFPGDRGSGASARNTIQCRCTEVYERDTGQNLDINQQQIANQAQQDDWYAEHGYREGSFTHYRPEKGTIDNAMRAFRANVDSAAARLDSMWSNARLQPLMDQIKTNWREYLNEARPAMRVPKEALHSILKHGVKNQRETGESRGSFDPDGRTNAEHKGLGYPKNLPAGEYPVYGYMEHPYSTNKYPSNYGDVLLLFKDSIRDRTTVTFGDSLGAMGHGDLIGTPVNKAGVESIGDRARALVDFDVEMGRAVPVPVYKYPEASENQYYIEAQYHGGVGHKDIKEVIFNSNPSKAVQAELDALEIPWSVDNQIGG